MLLRFYLFSTVTGCPNTANKRYCDAAFAGIAAAEQILFGQTFTDNWDEFFTTLPEPGERELLGLGQLPAFIVYDVDRQQALFKLEKRHITQANVLSACLTAWRLQPDPDRNDTYLSPSGEKLTTAELMATKPCPNWVPEFLCSDFGVHSGPNIGLDIWLLLFGFLLLLFLLNKALR